MAVRELEKWIWLPAEQYPDSQTTIYHPFDEHTSGNYTVAEFIKDYKFEKKICSAKLRFSGDTEFQLFCNGEFLTAGPVSVGGDFLGNEKPRPNFYASELEILPNSFCLNFFVRVKMMPVIICQYSKGHGGFMLTGHLTFEDGTKAVIMTDSDWMVRKNGAYIEPYVYDERIKADAFVSAEVIENIWHTETAPLLMREEKLIIPSGGENITVEAQEEKTLLLEFDMIYAGFVIVSVNTKGILKLKISCRETEEEGSGETLIFNGSGEYRGLEMHSAGKYELTVWNESEEQAEITVKIADTYYPVKHISKITTSDQALNEVLDVCRHTLKHCRQLHHLDSPRHCEPLACTGDYYIESLMTAFSFGDMSLAEFDIVRTAELLRNNDGRMFHTTYSLIWVRMLYEVYLFTGHEKLLWECEDALHLLMKRFETYIGQNGLVEDPPDYMFIDWIYIDEISMHHPPKALGQTCLNLFYYDALQNAAKIYRALSQNRMAEKCIEKSEILKKAVNELLYDAEKGMYFEGLNTPSPEHRLYQYLPQNVEKRYYLKHSNILASYVGICDEEIAKKLLQKVMEDKIPGDYQPYFAHFLLEAIYKNGLREKYTREVLEKWKAPVAECPKGLVEGFLPPEPTYSFDHSHAWGGTPLYSLPMALIGLHILKPGMKELKLQPSLLGLAEARVELPTPYGEVILEMKEGEVPKVTYPKEITVYLG